MRTTILYLLLMSPAAAWYFACLNLVFTVPVLFALLLIMFLWTFKVVFPVMYFIQERTS
jgi:hypothetical protein